MSQASSVQILDQSGFSPRNSGDSGDFHPGKEFYRTCNFLFYLCLLYLKNCFYLPSSFERVPKKLPMKPWRKKSQRYNKILKVEKILKVSLDSIPSPSPSVKIRIMGGKVCLRCKGKTLLGVVNKLSKTKCLLTSPSNVLPYYLK